MIDTASWWPIAGYGQVVDPGLAYCAEHSPLLIISTEANFVN